ncbi:MULTISPECIES: restriction endonuclease subunit S [unclassified Citrobacter]|uniref:restriction endonuclease subunit S n=1 Tax=Citrobacter TaxID=544 RepID=UPI0010C945E5|nr:MULTISPECIES: restriction endonuclease subunit S [unclassified Citrobacter]TKU34764.1 restriction endonuclease subunit S [Citrobacter sp. wls717]TKU80929.1 restriction endonuclease subunit S [Citrobacter sp. wls707]
MAKYKAYPEYKDSGVEWLGVIPKGWTISKVKYLAPFQVGWTPPTKNDANFIGDNLWVNISDLKDKFISSTAKCISDKAAKEASMDITPRGSLLYSFKLSVGAVSFAGCDLYTNEAIASFLDQAQLPLSYLYYALPIFIIENASTNIYGAKILNQELIKNSFLLAPSHSEAKKVAQFLDHETAKIDNLIEKQQQLIELLKEKRQAVISHAVTKGLNPDVPMKDSGVEWLGDVPAHWQALPTKRLFRLVAEPAEINNDYELLSVYTAIGVAPRKDLEPKGNKASTTDGYWKVRQGDIIVNKLLAWMGAVGFSNYDGVTSPAYDILRKVKDINPKFYHYLFRLELTQREFKRWSRGIMEMRLRLYFEELGRIIMPVPPREEQDVIVEEIEKIEYQYSQLENIASHQIDLLQERRTALISAAVTGKIDVRDWIAPDTQSIEEPQEATA